MKIDKKNIAMMFVASSIILGGCGQRPDTDSGFGTDPTSNSGVKVSVITNVSSILTGGTDTANITAFVTDTNNNALPGTDVVLSSSSGVLQEVISTSDENGEISAILKLPLDFQNQEIFVMAEVEGVSSVASLIATGSSIGVSGPDNLIIGDDAEIVISLVAGNDEPIANHAITVTSAAGNLVTPAVVMTDTDGRATINVATERGDDVIKISALNGSVVAEHEFEVSQDLLVFEDGIEESELTVAENHPIVVTWTSQSRPVAGQQLAFTVTAGEIVGDSTITTNASGQATVLLKSNSYGPVKLTVESSVDSRPRTSIDLEFVGSIPASLALDASVSRVEVNNTSTLFATITDAQGNPVKNQIVDFTSLDLKGGQISPASATSNSEGVASTTFTAGVNATIADDIEITATVKNTTIINSVLFTVAEKVLNVTLGSSNLLLERNFETQYSIAFVVQVADGGGAPIEGGEVELSIRPLNYFKGFMTHFLDEEGEPEGWYRSITATCASEDVNGNRILDPGEDLNGNGSLDPQDPALISEVEVNTTNVATVVNGTGSLTTDVTGSGFFELRYPRSHAMWAEVAIFSHAVALGTEAIDYYELELPLAATETDDINVAPVNNISPYGTGSSCLDTY